MPLDGSASSRFPFAKTYDAGMRIRARKTPISTEIGSRMNAATMKSIAAMQMTIGMV